MPADVREVLGPWADADRVPLAGLARRANLTRKQRQEVLEAGLVTPLGRMGRGGGYAISQEDAVRLAAAALLVVGGTVALVTILKFLSEHGASIGAAGVSIPLAAVP
jgi:hypothetical protein